MIFSQKEVMFIDNLGFYDNQNIDKMRFQGNISIPFLCASSSSVLPAFSFSSSFHLAQLYSHIFWFSIKAGFLLFSLPYHKKKNTT